MSILIDETTRAIVQGITGAEGRFHTARMLEDGTEIVGGVTPGKGGQTVEGVPVFDTVADAVSETGASASILFVPPASAADAIMEAAEAGVELIVCITEGIPIRDILVARRYVGLVGSKLVGPNTPGLISPGKSKLGVMAAHIHRPGRIGIVSRSGTLAYEVVHQLTALDIGQSTCIGIGGDPIGGLTFSEILVLFEDDSQTDGMVLIGEIGGSAEEDAADLIGDRIRKPVVGFVAGRTAPSNRRMGHAGAIITRGSGAAAAKISALRAACVTVVDNPAEIGSAVASKLSG